MNGPEHYLEAERRLLMGWEEDSTPERSAYLVAEAHVHATLALAAATAMAAPVDGETAGLNVEGYEAWRAAIGSAAAASPTAPGTVYIPSHDSIHIGLYDNEAAAREHCEQLLSNEYAPTVSLTFDWIEDEEDGIAELVATTDGDPEQPTGYVVTRLTVDSEYDPEDDA